MPGLLALLTLLLNPVAVAPPATAPGSVTAARISRLLGTLYPHRARWPGEGVVARIATDDQGLRLEVHRAQHRRVLRAPLPGLERADDAAVREALRHTMRYLLEAPVDAGTPLQTPQRRAPSPPPPIPAAARLSTQQLNELVPPLPAFPVRPPLILPRPPIVPDGPRTELSVWRTDPTAVPGHSRSDTIAVATDHPPAGPTDAAPRQPARMWLGLDSVWTGEPTGGLAIGGAASLSPAWALRGELHFEPFGEHDTTAGPAPLVDLHTHLALERRLTTGPTITRAHLGLGYHGLFTQSGAVTVPTQHRPTLVAGGTAGWPLGGPLTIGLRLDLIAAPWRLRAETPDMPALQRPLLQARLGAWLGWDL